MNVFQLQLRVRRLKFKQLSIFKKKKTCITEQVSQIFFRNPWTHQPQSNPINGSAAVSSLKTKAHQFQLTKFSHDVLQFPHSTFPILPPIDRTRTEEHRLETLENNGAKCLHAKLSIYILDSKYRSSIEQYLLTTFTF